MKVGMLTSGGDCQALNAAMRGVAKALYEGDKKMEIYGFKDGYKGLKSGSYKKMKPEDFSGILTVGGTILGTSRQPFKYMKDEDVKQMKDTYKKLDLDCIVILGGNGTHKTANLLRENGVNVVTLPKTIDNDLWGTDMTFGFDSAVHVATTAIDHIHTTAASHGRIFIVEIMGHKVGWMTLFAGIAGGADVILIPEIPYDLDKVAKALRQRSESGKSFSILAVAEGAISKEDAALSKKERKAKKEAGPKYPSIAYKLAEELIEATGEEVRITVPGHMQRGGSPTPTDRLTATRLGVGAAELVLSKQYGNMVAFKGDRTVPVPLSEVAGKLKTVPADYPLIQKAKEIGICFGD